MALRHVSECGSRFVFQHPDSCPALGGGRLLAPASYLVSSDEEFDNSGRTRLSAGCWEHWAFLMYHLQIPQTEVNRMLWDLFFQKLL